MWPRWPRYMNSIEIAEEMGVDKWSVSPRMKPLFNKGFLDDPLKKPALNSSGNIRNLRHWRVKRLK
jgi:Mn-dependent DtxR family transcriptional regulator